MTARAEDQIVIDTEGLQPSFNRLQSTQRDTLRHEHHAMSLDFGKLKQILEDFGGICLYPDDKLHLMGVTIN